MAGNLKEDPLILVNVVEELVKLQVKKSIQDLGACGCDVCFCDACALALNELKPKYATTRKGALITKITELKLENRAQILVAVTKAVMQVKDHPHHSV